MKNVYLLTNNIAIETKQIQIYIKIRKNKLFYASIKFYADSEYIYINNTFSSIKIEIS